MQIPQYYSENSRPVIELSPKREKARQSVIKKINEKVYDTVQVNCPICNSSDQNDVVSQRDMYGFPVYTVICSNCDLVYTNPRLTNASLGEFYNTEYRTLDRPDDSTVDDFFLLQQNKGAILYDYLRDLDYLDKIRGKTIVEVGCGAGGILDYFREKGFNTIGCDIGQEYLNYGKDKKGLNLIHGQIDDLDSSVGNWESVGLIIYEQVLEHIPNPIVELNKLKKIMGKTTLVYIGVPGLRNIENSYNNDFIRFLQIPHLLHFTEYHLSQVMSSLNFVKIHANEKIQSLYKISEEVLECSSRDYYQKKNYEYIIDLNKRRKKGMLRNFPYVLLRFIFRTFFPYTVRSKIRSFMRQPI